MSNMLLESTNDKCILEYNGITTIIDLKYIEQCRRREIHIMRLHEKYVNKQNDEIFRKNHVYLKLYDLELYEFDEDCEPHFKLL